MLPAGEATEDSIDSLQSLLNKDDIIVDGGNTFYKDDIRRSLALEKTQIKYVDAGVSGGIWGLKERDTALWSAAKNRPSIFWSRSLKL